jgi:hypothetical protein
MIKNILLMILFLAVCVSAAAQSPYISKVFDFRPAPGQFVNVLPEHKTGDSPEDMIRKVEEAIAGDEKGLVSLGAFGGYIIFGFDHLVENRPGKYDFKIWGNAYYYNENPGPGMLPTGACEPGIVMVSYDANGNGIPDDPWYELAGSEYYKPETVKNYEITYYKPDPDKIPTPDPIFPFLTDTSYVKWTDNQGDSGYVARNAFHSQPYYPLWLNDETLTYEGTKLANNGEDKEGTGQNYVQYAYPFGYADNHPNSNIRSNFDIGWAVDEQGNKVELPGIHFVKVYTGVNQYCGWLGETSTEIMGAEDFHIQGIDIDVLRVQTEVMPDARVYYAEGYLYLENLDDCYCTLYNINGQTVSDFKIISSRYTLEKNLISGVYILKIQKQTTVKIFKFYINH